VKNRPMVSFLIFDQPHNWQAMLEWLWEYGEKFHGARSITPLDPQKLSALACQSIDSNGDDAIFHEKLRSFQGHAKRISEGVLDLLSAFPNIDPLLSIDKSSQFHDEAGHEKWHIKFS